MKQPSSHVLNHKARTFSLDLNVILMFVTLVGLLVYGYWVYGAIFHPQELNIDIKDAIRGRYRLIIGLPISALVAHLIVTLLLHSFPPSKDQGGQISFKFIGLEFSGPAGPVTLWLACFLAIVGAMSMLSPNT